MGNTEEKPKELVLNLEQSKILSIYNGYYIYSQSDDQGTFNFYLDLGNVKGVFKILSVSPSCAMLFPITENKINCKYFQIISLVLSVIFKFHKCLNTIPGKNSVFILESLFSKLNISSFLYNISKNRSGKIFLQ